MSKPFCLAPWVNLNYTGTRGATVCCEWIGETYKGNIKQYYDSDYLKDIKTKMFEGGYEKNCDECIAMERVGRKSSRHWYNQYQITDGLQQLDYRPGNTCNLMCRMCSPESSSLIAEEEQEIVLNLNTSDVNNLDLTKLKKIAVLGGEPSVDLKTRSFLKELAKVNTTTDLEITTNATNASKKWFDLLRPFENLIMVISLDGAGPVYDYVRHLAKWDEVSKNLEKYQIEFGNKAELKLHMTAITYNYGVIDSWFDYFINDCDIELEQFPAVMPEELSLASLKPKYKDIVLDWLAKQNNHKCNDAIKIINSFEYDETLFNRFVYTTRMKDSKRNTNIEDVHPRFKEMMLLSQ